MKKILFSLFMLCCVTAAVAGPVPGGYTAANYSELKAAVTSSLSEDRKTSNANIKLTADIYLKDEGELCNTFIGTLDGNGYTIYAGDETAHHDGRGLAHGKYLFVYSKGATFKNLTFMDFRADTEEHSNWSILTSQATNGCVFENITFDHVSIWSNYSNVGAVAGIADNCTFTNITVKNSDFTVDDNCAGALVGDATGCTFTNIEVRNSTTDVDDYYSGGVVGHAADCSFDYVKVIDSNIKASSIGKGDYVGGVAGNAKGNCSFTNIEVNNCQCYANYYCAAGVAGYVENVTEEGTTCSSTFSNINILGCFITVDSSHAGGISGYSNYARYSNCVVDEQTCICSDGDDFSRYDYVGGIIGEANNDEIRDCINSALVTGDYCDIGGIAGHAMFTTIENCLNTGLAIGCKKSNVIGDNGYYSKFKNKEMETVTKNYKGTDYTVSISNDYNSSSAVGGIVGDASSNTTISKCTNIGSANGKSSIGGILGLSSGGSVTISDCLNDFTASIFGDKYVPTAPATKSYDYITNCLDLSDKKIINTQYITITNLYDKDNITEAKLLSGEICASLGAAWEQNLGTDPYPTPTGNKGLYHSRNITNEYGTAYLPYAMTSDENISFYTFESETSDEEGIKLKFIYAENVPARTPVLYRTSGIPTAESPICITINDAKDGYKWRDVAATVSGWTMEGTYQQRVFEGNEAKSLYYISGGVIKNAQKVTIAPYRAYFHGPSIETLNGSNGGQAKAIRFVIEDADGSTTALEFVGNDLKPVQNGKTYSIMGTEVGENYRGIVIKNGKKVLKK